MRLSNQVPQPRFLQAKSRMVVLTFVVVAGVASHAEGAGVPTTAKPGSMQVPNAARACGAHRTHRRRGDFVGALAAMEWKQRYHWG